MRVVVQGDDALIEALSADSDRLILSPVETSLEISARVTQADVVVVDVAANRNVGLAAIQDLTFDRPVLALVNAGGAAEAMEAGASGAIRRDSRVSAIVAAIHAVHQGLTVFDGDYQGVPAAQAVHHGGTTPAAEKTGGVLTPRENEVLTLLAEGLSNKEIAAKLEISEHTAKFHVNSILQKMNAQKRVEAVVRAAKMGLIEI
ncbi:MAG: response regulator transcription factor [Myxococcota bacterium]